MDAKTKTKFLNTSALYLRNTERDSHTPHLQNVAEFVLLEKKMSNRFLKNSKSVLLDKIS